VWGIARVKATALWDSGARTIEDLFKPKYHQMLNANQQIGLRYFEDLQKRIPPKGNRASCS
jgi:hypothetical protein